MVKNDYELAASTEPDSGGATSGGVRQAGWRGRCLGCARWQWMVALLVATALLLVAALVGWLVIYHLQYSTVYPADASKLYMNATGVTEGDMMDADLTQQPVLWPQGRVVYDLDPAIGCPTSSRCEVLMSALEMLDNSTCLQFVAADSVENDESADGSADEEEDTTYPLLIKLSTRADGCYSTVGYQSEQNATRLINLDYGCFNLGVILHQLGHSIGLWHEHNRADRDTFIEINETNADPNYGTANFDKYTNTPNSIEDNFDLESIMMFGPYAFASGQYATITPSSGNLTELWERESLSEQDITRINQLYQQECSKRS